MIRNSNVTFSSEKELVDTITKLIELTAPNSSTVIFTEVDCGSGIADIVIAELAPSWELCATLSLIPPKWLYPLVALPYRKTISLSAFARCTAVSQATARAVLGKYVQTGYCVQTPSGYQKRYAPRQVFKNIVAIEAKLRNWRRALYQARRYQSFAHTSWAILDAATGSAAAKSKHAFFECNVGLALLHPNGQLESVTAPLRQSPISPAEHWRCTGEMLRRLLPQNPAK